MKIICAFLKQNSTTKRAPIKEVNRYSAIINYIKCAFLDIIKYILSSLYAIDSCR